MKYLAIVVLCVLTAVGFGIAHDLVTARLCVEYYTVGHPRVFDTDDPIWLGIGWGIVATWWVGLLLGIPMALASRLGGRPKRSALSLVAPLGALLVALGLCAALAGLIGWLLATAGVVVLVEPLATRVPPAKHALFVAALWAHVTSYVAGFLGAIVLCARTWRSRGRAQAAAQSGRR